MWSKMKPKNISTSEQKLTPNCKKSNSKKNKLKKNGDNSNLKKKNNSSILILNK